MALVSLHTLLSAGRAPRAAKPPRLDKRLALAKDSCTTLTDSMALVSLHTLLSAGRAPRAAKPPRLDKRLALAKDSCTTLTDSMALVSLHTLLSAGRAPRAAKPPRLDKRLALAKDSCTTLTAVASTPVTEASQAASNVVLCSSISSPELQAGPGAKPEPQAPEPAAEPLDSSNNTQAAHAASETSSDTGELMFSELEVFADEAGAGAADDNSNEENDVDDETMSGENDIEGAVAWGRAGDAGSDILSRLLCAVQTRGVTGHGGVTPAGTDGSAPAPVARPEHDPQLSTAAHTDMLLLNLMRINGLTPKHARHGPKRHWAASTQSPESEHRSPTNSGQGSRGPRRASTAASRSRRLPRTPMLSPGQLRHTHHSEPVRPAGLARTAPPAAHAYVVPGQLRHTHHNEPVRPAEPDRSGHCSGAGAGTSAISTERASSPALALHDYWPSVSSVSDNDEVELILDYNDTLFDMLLNTLSLESPGAAPECLGSETGARAATPPVQPWSPPSAPAQRDLD
ncbi:uncharacterized protein LOC135072120 [Ostrinia nubilalis]|uniref:uncharacterized protein LOC135072120 n=1 Tax=Ostrinia nubilalis TaxID=29057 RepID=UPI0030822DE0